MANVYGKSGARVRLLWEPKGSVKTDIIATTCNLTVFIREFILKPSNASDNVRLLTAIPLRRSESTSHPWMLFSDSFFKDCLLIQRAFTFELCRQGFSCTTQGVLQNY